MKSAGRWPANEPAWVLDRFQVRSIVFSFAALLLLEPARGLDYPWGILIPENDSRDLEVRDYDEANSAT